MKTMPVLLQRNSDPTTTLLTGFRFRLSAFSFSLTLFISAFCFLLSAFSQPTTFTYQGRLDTSGQPTTGLYGLCFTLYDAYTAGNTVGAPVNAYATPVTNGLFTALLDYGAGAFDGNPRFLGIAVRPTGSTNALVVLAPRQFLSSPPYAPSRPPPPRPYPAPWPTPSSPPTSRV